MSFGGFRCVCIEGWRWFDGLCYPPESTNGLCIPKPPRIAELFLPKVKKADLLISGVYEIEIALPLESHSRYGSSGNTRLLSTEIKWLGGGNGSCDYPYGSQTPFFSKGTTYPQCEDVIGAYWYLEKILRCPWNGRFDSSTPTITRLAALNITRYYEVFDPASGSYLTEIKSAMTPIQIVTRNPLANAAPVYEDEEFYDNTAETLPIYLLALLGVVGCLAAIVIAATVALMIWRRRVMAKIAKKGKPVTVATVQSSPKPGKAKVEKAALESPPAVAPVSKDITESISASIAAPPRRHEETEGSADASSAEASSNSAAREHEDRTDVEQTHSGEEEEETEDISTHTEVEEEEETEDLSRDKEADEEETEDLSTHRRIASSASTEDASTSDDSGSLSWSSDRTESVGTVEEATVSSVLSSLSDESVLSVGSHDEDTEDSGEIQFVSSSSSSSSGTLDEDV
jgi:hypothetical protein